MFKQIEVFTIQDTHDDDNDALTSGGSEVLRVGDRFER